VGVNGDWITARIHQDPRDIPVRPLLLCPLVVQDPLMVQGPLVAVRADR